MDLPAAPSGPPGKPIGNGASADNGAGKNNGHTHPSPPPPPPPARGDPSKPRREALKRHERPPIPLSNLCPIDKYYAAADKVLGQFKAHLASMELDEAYIIGRRFALFSTVSLPQHDYYKSPRADLTSLRLKNQKDAHWVTRGLERIVEVMDKQEVDKQKEEAERLRKQKQEEERKRVEWEESMRHRLEASSSGREKLVSMGDGSLDMASKLEKLNALFPQENNGAEAEVAAVPSTPPPTAPSDDNQLPPLPPPIAPPLHGSQGVALNNSTLAAQNLTSTGATPWYPEEPPSYTDLFLDTLRTPTPSLAVTNQELAELEHMPSPVTAPKVKPQPRTPIRVIQQNCSRQLQSLKDSKHIEIIRLGTYQGRLGAANPRFDSTNGCAVISPLVVAMHINPHHDGKQKRQSNQRFNNAKTNASQYGITNSAINEIIDRSAPPILQTVRGKLGLNKHALIIPSDVHDYLVDEHILPQDKFVGVCGGDILNKMHTNELVTMLVNGRVSGGGGNIAKGKKSPQRQKVGAALFFREHVVSIVKIPLRNGAYYYDLIDSLPSSWAGGMASRTRCKDLASFEVLLRWYASSKFSDSNCNFIDDNEWDDGMCDFDPRVFQGFVWAE